MPDLQTEESEFFVPHPSSLSHSSGDARVWAAGLGGLAARVEGGTSKLNYGQIAADASGEMR